MPISHELHNIDKIRHGGAPDIVWCAKMILRLKIDYTETQRNIFLNLIRDLNIDPVTNPNIFAIDFGDGMGVHYLNTLDLDYEFRNNIKDTYNITIYSNDDKVTYYPIDSSKDEIHYKVDNIVFNYNPQIKPSTNYEKRIKPKTNIDSIVNGVIPYNAEEIYVVYHNTDIVFGSKIDAEYAIYTIEITDPSTPIRLINPLSHPRFSWERLKHNIEVVWGDGYISKLYDYYINSGRFNRFSNVIPTHTYNATVGQQFQIKVKSKEPLVPIGCKLLKIEGSLPPDNYLVRDSKYGSNIVGLFGDCSHEDYPEISKLTSHRSTVTYIGKDVCKNYLNTNMHNHFKDFTALQRIEDGCFDSLLGYCIDYSSCFENNINLAYAPKNLLGYVNNIVTTIDNMFKNTPKLKESLELRKSTSLLTANNLYQSSGIPKLYDMFLYECPNLVYANNICRDANSLTTISLNQFKFSNSLQEMSYGFYNTKISTPMYLSGKTKLWNLNSAFMNISTLKTLNQNMFTSLGSESNTPVDINFLFKNSGNNCIVSNNFFESLKDVKSFTDTIESIMENFSINGSDFPSQLFNNVFNTRHTKTYTLLNPFKSIRFSSQNIELLNKIFVGDNTKLNMIDGFIRNTTNRIAYVKKDLLSSLPNLKGVDNYFNSCNLDCIFPETFLETQKQLTSAVSMFESVHYKYNHFPIDYLIRTNANDLDLTKMFYNSNIKTYKIIHWSANKSLRINATNIVNINTQTVPLSFIVDNRTLLSNEIAFTKSSINFLVATNANGSVTFKAINPTETCIVAWGDGTTSTFNTSTQQVTHTYSTKGVYRISYTSKYAIIPITLNNLQFMEIKGEFPYNSIPDNELGNISLGSTHYLDSIMHIANMNYTNKLNPSPAYINPYYLKYGVKLKRIDLFSSNQKYNNLSIMPSNFYKNCVGLNDFENILNIVTPIIPDNIFPEQLINGTYTANKLWIGNYQDGIVYRNKQHITNTLFKTYMNDTTSPFGTSYMIKPRGVNLKTFTNKVNDPLDEYLGFVINKNVTNLGLSRLISNTNTIGLIKIEIFAGETPIVKELNITSDSQLNACIGNINIDPDVGFAYIRVYSKEALWLSDVSAIIELRGVIPPCTAPTLTSKAPNLEWYSETLLCRLQNTSFRGFMANLPRLKIVHRATFAANINASDFESCFENDTALLEVPDYLINSKEYDINCSKMFKGCTGVKYVYKPIDDSVRGRINVTEMFNGVKTVAFTSSNIDSQVFNRLWYIGSSGLGQHTSTLQRPTVDLPTVYGFTNTLVETNAESVVNSVYFHDNILNSNIISINNEHFKYAQSRIWNLSYTDILPKSSIGTSKYVEVLKYLPNITTLHFIDEAWYFDDEADPKIFQTFNPKLFMYNERLTSIRNGFSQSEILTPINSIFMKFNTVINSLNAFAKNTWIRHKDDIGKSAILGYDHLGWAFLGAEGIRIPLEFTGFLNSDLECLVDSAYMFYSSRLNLTTDKFSLSKCYPQNMQFMFGCGVKLQHERDRGIRVTSNLIKNIYSHTSNTTVAALVDQYANIESLFDGNLNNETSDTLPNRIISKAIILNRGLNNLFRSSYSTANYSANLFNELKMENNEIELDGVYENSNIDVLPYLPSNIKSMQSIFKNCKNLTRELPLEYIPQSANVNASNAFAGSGVRVSSKVSSADNIQVDNMLDGCISSINEVDMFDNYEGFTNSITPDRRYSVDNPNVFVQTITVLDEITIYGLSSLTTNVDDKVKFTIDWGDNTIEDLTMDTIEHKYRPGTYTVTFYLDNINFVPYIRSTDIIKTIKLSRLPISDYFDYNDQTFALIYPFGDDIEFIEDYFFKNVKNINMLHTLRLCMSLHKLQIDPIVIEENMISLNDLSYYYLKSRLGSNINDIPLSIKKQIKNLDGFVSSSNINITYDYIKDFINLESMNRFAEYNSGNITPYLCKEKEKLTDIGYLLSNSNTIITSEFNEFFDKCYSLKRANYVFNNCKIQEFPSKIIKYTHLLDVRGLFASSNNLDDSIFKIDYDFFPTSIEVTENCFMGRKSLYDYHEKVFYQKPNLFDIDNTFNSTGIQHIKANTIPSSTQIISAIGLFANTHPLLIDDSIVLKWDSRLVDITSILDNVIYTKTFDQIIGNSEYICTKNTYEYKKPQYELSFVCDKPAEITLIPSKDLEFPININMSIDYGDQTLIKTITKANSVDELKYYLKHKYEFGDKYQIKIMGELIIQLEIIKL